MQHEEPFADVEARFAAGQFRDARELLVVRRQELQRVDPTTFASLTAEVDLATGELEAARTGAERQLREAKSSRTRIIAHRILGEVHANKLEFEDSWSHYRAARTLCREGSFDSLAATTELSFWGWFSGVLPLESADVEFGEVRKAVTRSAHPHHVAELRLCVARVEARKGAIVEARRHWELAQKLLSARSNLKLQSQLELDGCMLALLSADLRAALDHTNRAEKYGDDSGYFRSSVAALIDRAHVFHATGDLKSARDIAETALARTGDHRQLRVAALDCLANVLLAMGDLSGAEETFEKITHLRPAHGT